MENENKMEKRGTTGLIPFVLGAAVGAAAGVYLTSDSGKENTRKLTAWLKEKREKGWKQFFSKKDHIETAIEEGRKAYRANEKKLVGV